MTIKNQNEFQPVVWKSGEAKNVTLMVTEKCQLRCKYCYFVKLDSQKRMSFDTGKKIIDFLLDNRTYFNEKAVILDFIGGEPFLEITLIDNLCDYFKEKTFLINHPWFKQYRLLFTTNGINYTSINVQKFIEKNKNHLDISITIDGTKKKHDLQRIFPDGSGSYDKVIKNIPLWRKQFPNASSKVTISSDDIPYLKESIIHIWELGIKNIFANVVFENVWKDEDDKLFEEQMFLLADEILKKEYYKDHQCTLFNKDLGGPMKKNTNWCGTGKILCADCLGNFYPCIRFTSASLQNKKPIIIGNCFDGIDHDKLRPFLALNMTSQSNDECVNCDISNGCSWCQGANYDFADTDTIYQRVTFLCKMHKARIKANKYFWEKYYNKIL